MQRMTTLKIEQQTWTPEHLLEDWRTSLQKHDHAVGTVKKYTQAVSLFLAWYEQEEQAPLTLSALTPIALIGYRNELQHEHRSPSALSTCASVRYARGVLGWSSRAFLRLTLRLV